jgi:hypothetical protein
MQRLNAIPRVPLLQACLPAGGSVLAFIVLMLVQQLT